MSQPKRYSENYNKVTMRSKDGEYYTPDMIEANDGGWVKWADYAALAAENEVLRKAGDAMAKHFEYLSEWNQNADGSPLIHPSLKAWLAAKEGGAK